MLGLNLERANFGTDGALYLSRCLSELQLLTSFDCILDRNVLSEQGVLHLAEAVRNLTLLAQVSLSLSGNKIGVTAVNELLRSAAALPKLSVFKVQLRNNGLRFGYGQTIRLDFLAQASFLTDFQVDLGDNDIGDGNVARLGKRIETLSLLNNLQCLSCGLARNKLTGHGVNCLVQSLSTLQQLSPKIAHLSLNLQGNRVGDERSCDVQWALLGPFPKVDLDLQGNGMRSGTASSKALDLTRSLPNFHNYKLDWKYNNVGYRGTVDLAKQINQRQRPCSITLTNNTTTFARNCRGLKSSHHINLVSVSSLGALARPPDRRTRDKQLSKSCSACSTSIGTAASRKSPDKTKRRSQSATQESFRKTDSVKQLGHQPFWEDTLILSEQLGRMSN